jgi:type VI protein secretion system component Hcp
MIQAGVIGGSLKVNHVQWLELEGWDFQMNVEVDPNVASGAPGKTSASGTFGFQIRHNGPALFKLSTLGRQIPTAVVFEAERSGLQGSGSQTASLVDLQLTFTGASVASRALSGDDGHKKEHIELHFDQVAIVYTPVVNGMPAAKVPKTIDIAQNKVT